MYVCMCRSMLPCGYAFSYVCDIAKHTFDDGIKGLNERV